MEKEGVIEKSTFTWLNLVVLTRKKKGELRSCLDLRKLNELVPLDEFEIPRIDELLSKLEGQKYFTTIDLSDGFFQINIRDGDKEKN